MQLYLQCITNMFVIALIDAFEIYFNYIDFCSGGWYCITNGSTRVMRNSQLVNLVRHFLVRFPRR